MLFSLVKKDYLIIKKYILIMLIVAAIIPPFFMWRMPGNTGSVGYSLACIFSVFLLLQYVSQKECIFSKATVLLCATPYSRKLMVIARYMFCLTVFALCTLIYGIETIFMPLEKIRIEMIIIMFLVTTVFVGLYLPLQYKYGFEKTKIIFMIIIMSSPVLCAWLAKNRFGEVIEKLLYDYSCVFVCCVIGVISCIIYLLSMVISVWIYDRMDII